MKRITRRPCLSCGSREKNLNCDTCVEHEVSAPATHTVASTIRRETREHLGQSAVTVALVGCGKQKMQQTSRACDMYTGQLFKLSYAHARNNVSVDDVFIISALHGLLDPFKEIAPYDLSINKLLISERDDWSNKIVRDIVDAYPLTRVRLVFYAGSAYVKPITNAARTHEDYWDMEDIMFGLDIFQRLAWLRGQERVFDKLHRES